MAINLVETIQKNLGFPALQKIDPNIHETKNDAVRTADERLAQAAIPAVLTFLYKLTRSDAGCKYILSEEGKQSKLDEIFEDKTAEAAEKVAQYAGVSAETAKERMEEVAEEAIKLIKESAGQHPAEEKIRTFMSYQRHNILVHLPAAMQLGDLLNDESLDDRTNKMEGPVSGFLHRIENILSESDQSKYP